jgi:predicted O-methyltransferase YrrM
MTNETWTAVDDYFSKLLLSPDKSLEQAQSDSVAAGLPAIAVSPLQGKQLLMLAQMQNPKKILEIGTLGGYSTIWLARAVGPTGSVVSLEYEPRHAEVATVNLRRAGVDDRVQIVVGAALDTLAGLTGSFDFVFIDADKENNPAYVRRALELGRPGTVIVVDNIVRNGRVLDPAADDTQAQAVRETLELMGRHPRLDTAAIQTVGVKGWDGFAVALVN